MASENVMRNRYASRCYDCHREVAEMAGWAAPPAVEGARWRTYCEAHKPSELRLAEVSPRLAPIAAPPIDDSALVNDLMARVRDMVHAQWLANVPAMVTAKIAEYMPQEIVVKIAERPPVALGRAHKALPIVLDMVASGASLFLVGPAGSGKTTLAENVAAAMGCKFYMAARVTSEFKLVGFVDANGRTVRTQFRDAYEHGGVFLFDEIDASDPDALTAFNAALANGHGDFPDGMCKRHPDFIAIAAGNTFGRGADRQYVGRNQLDAATLDRFQVVEIDYDETLEHDLAGNREWSDYVQRVRHAVEKEKVRHIVSPRASIRGAAMLAQGIERGKVEEACIWKGLPTDARSRVKYAMVGGR